MSATDFMRQLADQLAAEQAEQARQLTDDQKALCGVWSWVGASSLTLPSESDYAVGTVTRYGAEFVITEQMLLNSFDRTGHSPLIELLSDEAAQLQSFGAVVARRGAWPENALRTRPGTPEAVEAAQDARNAAWKIADPDARAAELARLRRVHGQDFFGDGSLQRSVDYDGGAQRESRPSDAR